MEYDPRFSVFSAVCVAEFLGLSGLKDGSVPKPQAGGRIIYLPPCIQSLGALRGTKAPMHQQDWYGKYPHSAKPGYWEVILPIPDSNRKNQSQQDQVVPPGFGRTPVLVDALLLSVYKLATGEDLLDNDWVRCPEQTSDGHRFFLAFDDGLLCVGSYWYGDGPFGEVWASAARWICA